MNNTEKFNLINEYVLNKYFDIWDIEVDDKMDTDLDECFAELRRGEKLNDTNYITLYMEYYGKYIIINISVIDYYYATNIFNIFKNNDKLFFKYFFMIGMKIFKHRTFQYYRKKNDNFRNGILIVNIIHYDILPIDLVRLLKEFL